MDEGRAIEVAETESVEQQFEAIRKAYGHPSKDEIREVMSETHPSLMASLKKDCELNIPLRKEGHVSQPQLCSSTLLRVISARCNREMKIALKNNDKKNFCYYYDVEKAASEVLRSIDIAETEIAGYGEKAAHKALAAQGLSLVADQQSPHYYERKAIFNRERNLYKDLGKRLEENKTGLDAIDYMFREVTRRNSRFIDHPNASDQYTLEGATFVKEAYGNMLEGTKPLYTPKPEVSPAASNN